MGPTWPKCHFSFVWSLEKLVSGPLAFGLWPQTKTVISDLIHPLVGDDRKGGRVVEDVMVLVLLPEPEVHVA